MLRQRSGCASTPDLSLSVREKVQQALIWLREHNQYYKDVRVDTQLLDSYADEFILPVHVEVLSPSEAQESLTSRYGGSAAFVVGEAPDGQQGPDLFGPVVVANVDDGSSSVVLRAAALEHIAKRGKSRVYTDSSRLSAVGDFNNPALLPMIYPTLFPYGLGGCEDHRCSNAV